jgi:signal transduction histidine kinase
MRPDSQIGAFAPPGPHDLSPESRTVLLGRWEAAHVVVKDPLVSTVHAAIIAVESKWQVRDLGSRNGTFVNGARITEVLLCSGDVIKLGNTSFRFMPGAERETSITQAIPIKNARHIDPNKTLSILMPRDPADALLASSVREPRAVAALLNLSNLVELAPPREELVNQAVSMIADAVLARCAALGRSASPGETPNPDAVPALTREALWGDEKGKPAARDELVAHALSGRKATMSSMGEAGFGAALPLIARGGILGALYLERMTPFSRHDLELLSIFATKLALALENDVLDSQLREMNAHLEAEVARRTEDVRRLSEERKDLLGMVAHDVRGALTFVKLLADPQALVSEGAKDPVALEALGQIGLRAEKTVELLSSLLDAQALEEGRIELQVQDVDLVELVRSLLVPLERWARGRKLALVLDAPAPVHARIDPARVEQVVQNLLANAIKNTRQGAVTLSLTQEEGRVLLRVADTGRGIPRELLAQLFKPVITTDASGGDPSSGRPRVGLGLAIAHRLVSLMRGKISVESSPGAGTTFLVELPAV